MPKKLGTPYEVKQIETSGAMMAQKSDLMKIRLALKIAIFQLKKTCFLTKQLWFNFELISGAKNFWNLFRGSKTLLLIPNKRVTPYGVKQIETSGAMMAQNNELMKIRLVLRTTIFQLKKSCFLTKQLWFNF